MDCRRFLHSGQGCCSETIMFLLLQYRLRDSDEKDVCFIYRWIQEWLMRDTAHCSKRVCQGLPFRSTIRRATACVRRMLVHGAVLSESLTWENLNCGVWYENCYWEPPSVSQHMNRNTDRKKAARVLQAVALEDTTMLDRYHSDCQNKSTQSRRTWTWSEDITEEPSSDWVFI